VQQRWHLWYVHLDLPAQAEQPLSSGFRWSDWDSCQNTFICWLIYCSALVLQVNLGKAWSDVWVCFELFLERYRNNMLGIWYVKILNRNVMRMLKLLIKVLWGKRAIWLNATEDQMCLGSQIFWSCGLHTKVFKVCAVWLRAL